MLNWYGVIVSISRSISVRASNAARAATNRFSAGGEARLRSTRHQTKNGDTQALFRRKLPRRQQ